MPEIEILSDSHARGIWAMEDRLWWPEEQEGLGSVRFLHGAGHHRETYEKSDGTWRIKPMRLTRLHREYL